MNDLISRSALLEELSKGTIITDDLYGMGIMAGNDHAMKKIEAAPAVDAVEVARQFLISSLENKNSLWYNIFNNSEKFNKMHQSFIGIRGSWKANESVFDYVARDKGFSKTKTFGL